MTYNNYKIFFRCLEATALMAPRGDGSSWALLMVGAALLRSTRWSKPCGHQGRMGESTPSSSVRISRGLLEHFLQRPGMMGVRISTRSRDIERLFRFSFGRCRGAGVLATYILVAEVQDLFNCGRGSLIVRQR